jgi:hypothetical protein
MVSPITMIGVLVIIAPRARILARPRRLCLLSRKKTKWR